MFSCVCFLIDKPTVHFKLLAVIDPTDFENLETSVLIPAAGENLRLLLLAALAKGEICIRDLNGIPVIECELDNLPLVVPANGVISRFVDDHFPRHDNLR